MAFLRELDLEVERAAARLAHRRRQQRRRRVLGAGVLAALAIALVGSARWLADDEPSVVVTGGPTGATGPAQGPATPERSRSSSRSPSTTVTVPERPEPSLLVATIALDDGPGGVRLVATLGTGLPPSTVALRLLVDGVELYRVSGAAVPVEEWGVPVDRTVCAPDCRVRVEALAADGKVIAASDEQTLNG